MAWNLRYDFRVSPARGEALAVDTNVLAEPGVDAMLKALVRYHQKTVRDATHPSFLEGNDLNVVSGGGMGDAIHPRLGLGTIVDLSSLARTIAEGRRDGNPAFKTFRLEDQIEYRPDAPSAKVWNAFLETHFWAQDEGAREEFLEDLFYALSKFPRNPVWVTKWDKLKQQLQPELRCLQALGMPRRDAPRILIALKYDAREAGTLLRPCQLDAGDFAHHYPSPPNRAPKDGGITMDLTVPRASTDLLPEFIHSQTLFKVEYWRAADRWAQKTSGPVACDLREARRQHELALQAAYGVHQPPWMEEFRVI